MAAGKKTGGRQKGSRNKSTVATVVASGGELPLEYMLRVMRDKTVDYQRRDWAADKAAPFVHNRLAAVEHTGKDRGPIEVGTVPIEVLAAHILRKMELRARSTEPVGGDK